MLDWITSRWFWLRLWVALHQAPGGVCTHCGRKDIALDETLCDDCWWWAMQW